MSPAVVTVEGLGKSYLIGHERPERYTALRDVLARQFTRLVRTTRATVHGQQLVQGDETEEYWALRNVSFEVHEGDVLGIIGRNGAGKSTLLKVLSRITEPTEGRLVLRGGVASLLEVGTGFHPELTGRENIFLNGSILGMSRSGIRRKFDEIVAFAEVERFIDTPVKRYSSGMYVRLAFAVAAHLEPEILVVDEVLAVGDTEFQRRCLGKMRQVSQSGRTVLFVSHQMAAIEYLCNRCIFLCGGSVQTTGKPKDVIAEYLAACNTPVTQSLRDRTDRRGHGVVRFSEISFESGTLGESTSLVCGEDCKVRIGLANHAFRTLRNFHVSIGVENTFGHRVTTWSTSLSSHDLATTPDRDFDLLLLLPRLALAPGTYTLYMFVTVNGEIADWLLPAGSLDVIHGNYYGNGRLPGERDGTFLSDHSFQLEDLSCPARTVS